MDLHFPAHLLNYVFVGIGFFLFIYFTVVYNNLIALKNNVKKAWANIDVLLKQRHDELPKLIEVCKQYMQYERDTLDKITKDRAHAVQAREQGDVTQLAKAEMMLKGSLGQLFALVENYPELKTNETYAHLRNRISGLENTIADRRELYNESATINNIRLEQFPDVLIAKLFHFKPFTPLEFISTQVKDVDVSAQFKR